MDEIEFAKLTRWVTCGLNEKGQLVQLNLDTKEIRELDEWVEIWEEKE